METMLVEDKWAIITGEFYTKMVPTDKSLFSASCCSKRQ